MKDIEIKEQVVEWMKQYKFMAFVTLTLENENIDSNNINKLLLEWVRYVQRKEGVQVCYLGVISHNYGFSRKHIHLLISIKNRFGRPFDKGISKTLAASWYSHAKVKSINGDEDLVKRVKYIVYGNMRCNYELLTPYNSKLLKHISSLTNQKSTLKEVY